MAYLTNHFQQTGLYNTINWLTLFTWPWRWHHIVETSVTNNSSFQNYLQPGNHTMQTANMHVAVKIPMQNHKTTVCCKVQEKINRCTSIILLNSLKKRLRGHPNIVQFYSAASLSEKETDHGMSEYLILTELCSGKMFWLPSPERIALFTFNFSL